MPYLCLSFPKHSGRTPDAEDTEDPQEYARLSVSLHFDDLSCVPVWGAGLCSLLYTQSAAMSGTAAAEVCLLLSWSLCSQLNPTENKEYPCELEASDHLGGTCPTPHLQGSQRWSHPKSTLRLSVHTRSLHQSCPGAKSRPLTTLPRMAQRWPRPQGSMGAAQTPQMFCRDTSASWCVQMMGREPRREDTDGVVAKPLALSVYSPEDPY